MNETSFDAECDYCGKVRQLFVSKGRTPRYCGNACRQAAWRERQAILDAQLAEIEASLWRPCPSCHGAGRLRIE